MISYQTTVINHKLRVSHLRMSQPSKRLKQVYKKINVTDIMHIMQIFFLPNCSHYFYYFSSSETTATTTSKRGKQHTAKLFVTNCLYFRLMELFVTDLVNLHKDVVLIETTKHFNKGVHSGAFDPQRLDQLSSVIDVVANHIQAPNLNAIKCTFFSPVNVKVNECVLLLCS